MTACFNDLWLITQLVLPLPLVCFPLRLCDKLIAESDSDIRNTSVSDLQRLLDLLAEHRLIITAIWSPLSNTENILNEKGLTEFRARLMQWKSKSGYKNYDEDSILIEPQLSESGIATLPIPPDPLPVRDMEAALAAATFHSCMARVTQILSKKAYPQSSEVLAHLHVYHFLQIIEACCPEESNTEFNQRLYHKCNAIKIGLVPLLFLAAQNCREPLWLQYMIKKLRSIGEESIYKGEIYADALDFLHLFQRQADRVPPIPSAYTIDSQHNNATSSGSYLVPVVIPGPEEKEVVAYYVRALPATLQESEPTSQIIGKANWLRSTENFSKNVSIEFFDAQHPINMGLGEHCLYFQLASHEPLAREWEIILGLDSLGTNGYFTRLAQMRQSSIDAANISLSIGAVVAPNEPVTNS